MRDDPVVTSLECQDIVAEEPVAATQELERKACLSPGHRANARDHARAVLDGAGMQGLETAEQRRRPEHGVEKYALPLGGRRIGDGTADDRGIRTDVKGAAPLVGQQEVTLGALLDDQRS